MLATSFETLADAIFIVEILFCVASSTVHHVERNADTTLNKILIIHTDAINTQDFR